MRACVPPLVYRLPCASLYRYTTHSAAIVTAAKAMMSRRRWRGVKSRTRIARPRRVATGAGSGRLGGGECDDIGERTLVSGLVPWRGRQRHVVPRYIGPFTLFQRESTLVPAEPTVAMAVTMISPAISAYSNNSAPLSSDTTLQSCCRIATRPSVRLVWSPR